MSSIIFQSAPRGKSTYIVHPVYSLTDSLESYYRRAGLERLALQLNCHKPTKELVLRLLVVYAPIKLNNIIKRVKKILRKYRIDCCIAVESTLDEYKKKLTDRAHLHIQTDDTRPLGKLREIVSYACWNQGLVPDNDYDIICSKIDHRYDPTYYFTKTGRYKYKAILLHKTMRFVSSHGTYCTLRTRNLQNVRSICLDYGSVAFFEVFWTEKQREQAWDWLPYPSGIRDSVSTAHHVSIASQQQEQNALIYAHDPRIM